MQSREEVGIDNGSAEFDNNNLGQDNVSVQIVQFCRKCVL